jgi:serine/threonine-protein kinase
MGIEPSRPEMGRDALIGKLALDLHWVTALQLREALAEQWAEVEGGKSRGRSLGSILVARGLLSEVQLEQLQEQIRAAIPVYPPFGKYALIREIGRGAMGVVYDAEDTELGRRVALKMLIAPQGRDPEEARPEQDRFRRESQLHKSLPPHPGIVPVLEAGVIEGRRYLAMELIDGVPLGVWTRHGSVTTRQRVALLRDVALAVHHAHRHGILHRDLKPENILVDRTHQARITDFGLARLIGGEALPLASATGTALGTPAYMSPEQIRGGRTIDARSDVYALGVMLYEILTGRRPFSGESPYEIMMKTVNEEVVPPSKITSIQINPVLYRNLENICLIALSKDARDRYSDAEAFARDLTKWLKGEDVRIVLPKHWRVWRSRKFVPTLAGALLLAAALAAGAAWRAQSTPPGAEPGAALSSLSARSLRPGSVAEYFAGMKFNVLGLRKIDHRTSFNDPELPLWREGPGWYTSRRWSGYLEVPASARYVFEVRSQEWARLVIGDTELYTGSSSATVPISLAAGLHRFLLEHAHQGPEDTVAISWRKEGDATPARLGPGLLLHAPQAFTPVHPQPSNRNALGPVPGAEEGETLKVLENTAGPAVRKAYGPFAAFWKGTWSGTEHLLWSPRMIGDRFRVEFAAGETGPGTLAMGLTRTCDHGIFKVTVNKAVVAEALDLWNADLVTQETEFRKVKLRSGANELEFEVVGSNPSAREWAEGNGLYKLGIDYVVVR